MSLKLNIGTMVYRPRLALASLLAASLFWPSLASAEERLPWEAPGQSQAGQAAASGSYATARTDVGQSNAGRYGYDNGYRNDHQYRRTAQGDYRAPVIRQPRADPSQDPDYQPRQNDRAPQTYGRNYDSRRNGSGSVPSYSRPAPYRSEYADPPANSGRQADYNPRYDNRRQDAPRYDSQGPYDQSYDRGPSGSYSMDEIVQSGGNFFGSVSKGLASVIEYAFKRSGRPNGYILGEGAGGAFIAGLRYGEGTLYTKTAGRHKVYWQGPSIGYDAGAEGSKTMVLVYNLHRPSEIYHRFGGVSGSAYFVGGVGINFQKRHDVLLAPIRAGVGLRLGANIGYLKYTRRPTWNPF